MVSKYYWVDQMRGMRWAGYVTCVGTIEISTGFWLEIFIIETLCQDLGFRRWNCKKYNGLVCAGRGPLVGSRGTNSETVVSAGNVLTR